MKNDNMPTEPNERVLNRELQKVKNQIFLIDSCSLLQELVNYATHAFLRCASSPNYQKDIDLPILLLYLHTIEMTDGIEVLISQSCATPAIPLVRSSFEAFLSIEFLVEDECNYKKRSLAWLNDYVHNRLSLYQSLNPSSEKGKEFLEIKRKDKIASDILLPSIDVVEIAEKNLVNFLKSDEMREVEEAFRISKKSKKSRPSWFSLFNGPSTMQKLAQHVKYGIEYEILYRQWSQISHAHDISRFIGKTIEGESAIFGLRNQQFLPEVFTFSSIFLLNSTRLLLKKFRPSEDIKTWYSREIRSKYMELIKNLEFRVRDLR